MRATKAIIHLNNLIHNLKAVRKRVGEKPLICVPVKADGYGHGAVQVSKTALENGASKLLVATVDEGVILREAGIEADIFLITQALPEELETLIASRLTPFVSDKSYAADLKRAAAKLGKRSEVYLKIDTGMGRMGSRPEDAVELAQFIAEQKNLHHTGTVTHLAVSDSADSGDIEFTQKQIRIFNETIDGIRKAEIDPGIISAANSGGVITHDISWFDMVRPGIFTYGYQEPEQKPDLEGKPVMEFVTQVALVKKVLKGESVSYGRTWTAPEDTYIGVLPAGYADGLPRTLSVKTINSAGFFVVINGEKYPLIGRICMDQCMINLGPLPKVKLHDKVILFGPDAPALSAAGVATRIGTISYEVCCNINKRVPRVYV